MLIVSDHDVLGAAAVLRRVLDSDDWAEYASEFGICFSDFAALGLQADAPDRLVWETCQAAGRPAHGKSRWRLRLSRRDDP